MNRKIGTILDTGKKKAIALTMSGALILALSTGVVLAANAASVTTDVQVKDNNGARVYSTDDGKTWGKNAPDGLIEATNEDGTFTASIGTDTLPDGGIIAQSNEDGTASYSTDGGKTWSKNAPEGITTSVSEDGSSISVKSGD